MSKPKVDPGKCIKTNPGRWRQDGVVYVEAGQQVVDNYTGRTHTLLHGGEFPCCRKVNGNKKPLGPWFMRSGSFVYRVG